jgi:pimeloyl-ACP methyl ester carboxylesterase
VLKIASENPPIAAVISQVPHVNGMASLMAMNFKDIVSATIAGIRDVVSSTLFGRPYYSPAVGRPGSFAAMNTEDSWDGWYAIVPENSAWKNQVLSRVFLQMPLYSPGKSAARIKVPTLIVVAESDAVTPAVPAQKVANKIEKSECYILSNCGHFEPHVGQCFEKNIKFQLAFLKRHLG